MFVIKSSNIAILLYECLMGGNSEDEIRKNINLNSQLAQPMRNLGFSISNCPIKC